MRTTGARRLIGGLLVLMAVAVGACGGDSGGGATEDRAKAERILLTQADLPGFTVENSPNDEDASAALAECIGEDFLLVGNNPRKATRDFTRGDADVSSLAILAESEQQAQTAITQLEEMFAGDCLPRAFRTNIERQAAGNPDLRFETPLIDALQAPDVADEARSWRMSFAFQAGPTRQTLSVDFAFIRDGRALAGLFAFDPEQPFPAAERDRLIRLLADRAARA